MRNVDWVGITLLGAIIVGILVNIYMRTVKCSEELVRLKENEGIMLDYLRQINQNVRPQLNNLADMQRQTEEYQRRVQDLIQRSAAPPQVVDPYHRVLTHTEQIAPDMWFTYGQVQRPITPDPEPGLAD